MREVRETLHVKDGDSRIAMVETLTWDAGAAVTTPVSRTRYQLGNHLGTAILEVDGTSDAGIISYEEYHPYGSTAWHAFDATKQVSAKRYRYTGMERDEETGLQCHGVRYYAAWLGRWTSADPIGLGDGVNRFGYARGAPIPSRDLSGLATMLSLALALVSPLNVGEPQPAGHTAPAAPSAASPPESPDIDCSAPRPRPRVDPSETYMTAAAPGTDAPQASRIVLDDPLMAGGGIGWGLYALGVSPAAAVSDNPAAWMPHASNAFVVDQLDNIGAIYGDVPEGSGSPETMGLSEPASAGTTRAREPGSTRDLLEFGLGAAASVVGRTSVPTGKTIGLGLDEDLPNHSGTGAIVYQRAGWQLAGLTAVDWGRASIDNY